MPQGTRSYQVGAGGGGGATAAVTGHVLCCLYIVL